MFHCSLNFKVRHDIYYEPIVNLLAVGHRYLITQKHNVIVVERM